MMNIFFSKKNKSSTFPWRIRLHGKNPKEVTSTVEPRGIRKVLDKAYREGERGVTLLLVMSILAALTSISFAMFNLVFSQLQIAGELSDSFIALYAADEGIERLLYEDRVSPANLCSGFGAGCYETNADFSLVNAFSGGCYSGTIDKSDLGSGVAQNTLRVTGQSRCGIGVSRFVRRAFQLIYTGPAP